MDPEELPGRVTLELVVAVAENDAIGRGNRLPWRLSSDLRRFKSLTIGSCVLMGRRTFESIGRALPGRDNLVLTRSGDFQAPGCTRVASLEEAIRRAAGATSLMVIGGAEVYRQSIDRASRIHLTLVHTQVTDGDTFFSQWRDSRWRETFREPHLADEKNEFDYTFVTLERSSGSGDSESSIILPARA